MATNKLIKPTNVTVQIPAFTDQPDQRVNSNCIDKSIDGINTLSDQIGKINKAVYATTASYGGAGSVSVDLSGYNAVIVMARNSDVDNTLSSVVIPVGRVGRIWNAANNYYRDVTVSATGISWTVSSHPSYPNVAATPQLIIAI